MTIDVIANPTSATVTTGGTTAPASGTSEMFTVTTVTPFPVLTSGFVMRVMDILDQGSTANYEIMEVTANANGTGVSWTVTRGVEGTAPRVHTAGWTLVPVTTAGGLDGRYVQLTGVETLDIGSFYIPNSSVPNIIMGPQSGLSDSAEINGLLQDIATGAGEGELWLPGKTYTAQSPIVLASNVNLRGPGTIQAGSSLITGGVIEAPAIDAITDVEVAINIDGGFGIYGATVGPVSALLVSTATRVRYTGKVTNCGQAGVIFQLGSTDCGLLPGAYFSGIGLYDGQGGYALGISDSDNCWAMNPQMYLCNCYGILGAKHSTGASYFNLVGGYFDKKGGPSTTAVGTSWSGAALDVASTAGFPVSGTLSVAGVGPVTYTGIVGGGTPAFTGCSPASGSVASGAAIRCGFENIGFESGCTDWSLVGFQSLNSGDNGVSASGAQAYIRGLIDTCQYHGVASEGNDNNIDVTVINPATVGASLQFCGVRVASADNNVVRGRMNDNRGAGACMEWGLRETGSTSGGKYDINSTGHTNAIYSIVGGASSTVNTVGSIAQLTVSASGLTASPDCASGALKAITFTTNNSVTIANPANPFTGALIAIEFYNNSGGALTGSVTWGSEYLLVGTSLLPANGERTTILFMYDAVASLWVQIGDPNSYPYAHELTASLLTARIENLPRRSISLATIALPANSAGTGTLQLYSMDIEEAVTLSEIVFLSGTTALSGGVNQWACILNSSLAVLAVSADKTSTAWNAQGEQLFTIATNGSGGSISSVTLTPGQYYFGLLVVATTLPTLSGVTTTSGANGLTPKLAGTSTTGLTNPASLTSPATAITATGNNAWVAAA